MFHSFKYPSKKDNPLKSYFTNTVMEDGVINFKPQSDCEIENILSDYDFKYPKEIKSVDDELEEYS